MKLRYLILTITIIGYFLAGDLAAQIYPSPRSVSFAKTYATQSRGSDVIGWNPANLGYEDNPGFSISFGVLPLIPIPSVTLANNAISASWYDTHLRQGGHLSDDQVESLLSAFPQDGWILSPQVNIRVLGMSFGRTAIALDVQSLNSVTIPRAIPEFMFKGIRFDEPLSLDSFNAESITTATLSLAHGIPVKLPILPDLNLGYGVKVIGGAGYAATDSAGGMIMTSRDQVTMRGGAIAKYSIGGFGYAFDLGVSSQLTRRISAGLAVNNFIGNIQWTDQNTETFHYSMDFTASSSDFFEEGVMDSLFEKSVSTDTSYASPGFRTAYPPYLVAGVQFDVIPGLSLFANYRMGLSNQFTVTTKPRLSFAGELRLFCWLPLRFGMTSSDVNTFEMGGGFGFEFKHYSLLFGISQSGGIMNEATGVTISLGQELRF